MIEIEDQSDYQQKQISFLESQVIEKGKRLNKILLLVKEEKELENKKLNKLNDTLKEQSDKIENLKLTLNNNVNRFNEEKNQLENELNEYIRNNQMIDLQITKYLSSTPNYNNNNNNDLNNNDLNNKYILERIEYYKNKQIDLQNKLSNLKTIDKEEELKSKFLKLSTTEKKLYDKVLTS
ncbi:hypothetical protein ACTFIU_003890 [Dictyostelium citrinum]